VITIDPAVASAVGVEAQPGAGLVPVVTPSSAGRLADQPGPGVHAPPQHVQEQQPVSRGGGGNTAVERSVDYTDKIFRSAPAGPDAWAFTVERCACSGRSGNNNRVPTRPGPAVNISGSISFGRLSTAPSSSRTSINHRQPHVDARQSQLKVGIDYQYVKDFRGVNQTPVCNSRRPPHNAALAGTSPLGYLDVRADRAPTLSFNDSLFSAFVQDDWRLSSSQDGLRRLLRPLSLSDGAQRDLRCSSTSTSTRTTCAARRLPADDQPRPEDRAAREHRHHTTSRCSRSSSRATRSSNPSRLSVNLNGTGNSSGASPGAPPFPASLGNPPPGYTIPLSSRTIFAVDPNFVTGRTFQNNIQLQRGIGRDYSAAIGFIYSRGYNLPTVNTVIP
jgi:hypothetical protein